MIDRITRLVTPLFDARTSVLVTTLIFYKFSSSARPLPLLISLGLEDIRDFPKLKPNPKLVYPTATRLAHRLWPAVMTPLHRSTHPAHPPPSPNQGASRGRHHVLVLLPTHAWLEIRGFANIRYIQLDQNVTKSEEKQRKGRKRKKINMVYGIILHPTTTQLV